MQSDVGALLVEGGVISEEQLQHALTTAVQYGGTLIHNLIRLDFITDEEQQARLQLRDKLVEAAFDQERGRVVLTLSRDELLFLIKVARENYSFIARSEKEARLALAAKLHKTAESVFGVSTREG